MADVKVLVAICHNLPSVLRQSTQSLMELGWGNRVQKAKDEYGIAEIAHAWYYNYPRVDALRDCAAADAIREGFTHILYLDADMVWPSDVLWKMLKYVTHDKAIVSAHYVMKSPPYGAVALFKRHREPGSNVDMFEHADLRGVKELVDVQVVGMGCCVVPVSVFEAIGARPWFAYKDDDDGWPRVTEDVTFCLKAGEAGYRIAVDPTVECGHVTSMLIDPRWTNRHRLVTEESQKHMSISVKRESLALVEPVAIAEYGGCAD